ncbi:hypothetical protein CRUP_030073 [Coryphaenoides rupestris]|nr:hypothetical protein CRUP_030073 [Coryphaenoides rupestris]
MDVEGRLRAMTAVFRRECATVVQSERVTIHGADSMLMILQLAMAQVNKQESLKWLRVRCSWPGGICCWTSFTCLSTTWFEPENYDLILKAYESFLKASNTVDLVEVHALCNRLRPGDEALNPVQMFEFLSGTTEDDPALMEPSVLSTPSSKRRPSSSQIQAEVRRVFLSYLDLLVNSKNDLALARVLDVPGRALGRDAFTDLRRAARAANTSMFLAVTSFVRTIQLGGKGYAPAESDPLRKHVKGLVCGGRLVAAIRAALIKGRGGGDEDTVYAAAAETAHDLKAGIARLHRQQQQDQQQGTGISPARPRAHAINHGTALGGRDMVKVLLALLDREAAAPPTRNKLDLLSPEVTTGDSPEPLKNRVQSQQNLVKPKVKGQNLAWFRWSSRVKQVRPPLPILRSQFACTYRDEEEEEGQPRLNRVLDFPSSSQMPSCVHPAPKTSSAALATTAAAGVLVEPVALWPSVGGGPNVPRNTGTSQNAKGNKRKQAEHDAANRRPPAKRPPVPTSAAATSVPGVPGKALHRNRTAPKAPSKKKLLAGQGKLTSFFRV